MNSLERVLAALRLGVPDRIPVFEWLIDPRVIDALQPGADLQEFVEAFGLDGISAGAIFEREYLSPSVYRDEWGVEFAVTQDILDAPIRGPIKSAADLEKYVFPDAMAPARLGDLHEHVRRFKGEKAIIFHQRAEFMWSALLCGIEQFLMNLIVDPDLCRAIISNVVSFSETLARRAVRSGADIVMLGDDYAYKAGPLMSPSHFKEFLLPGLAKVVEAIHAEGALCVKHSDGDIRPLMDMIVETGIDGINPIEPTAGMDIADVKKRYGRRVCILGNVDCVQTLVSGSVDDVAAEVKNCIRKAAGGGGYILMSSNSIHAGVKPANYREMIEAVHRFGLYPLAE